MYNVASVTKWNGKLLADGCEMAGVALFLMLYSRKDGKKREREKKEGKMGEGRKGGREGN